MHFRTRQKIVQLVRTSYDPVEKKPKAVVVGRMNLDKPSVTDELCAVLTDAEVAEAQAWIENQGRVGRLREEFAAATLADNLQLATNWLARHSDSRAAAAAVAELLPAFHKFRRTLREKGFL